MKQNIILDTQYKQLFKLFEKDIDHKNKIVLLGDSMISFFDEKKYFKNDNILNRGIPGDTTLGVLKRLHQIIKLEPSTIVLSIGSNDYARINENIEEVVKGILKIKYLLLEQLPSVNLYILSLSPVLRDDEISNYNYILNRNNDIIDEINNELALFTHIIDVNSYLKDSNGNLKKAYTTDGIHLSHEGYLVFSDVIAKNVKDLIFKKEK